MAGGVAIFIILLAVAFCGFSFRLKVGGFDFGLDLEGIFNRLEEFFKFRQDRKIKEMLRGKDLSGVE